MEVDCMFGLKPGQFDHTEAQLCKNYDNSSNNMEENFKWVS